MRTIFSLLMFLIVFAAKAQYLHTPDQIQSLQKESSLQYQLDTTLTLTKESTLPVLSFVYETLVSPDKSPVEMATCDLSKKALKHLKKANAFFKQEKYAAALENYDLVRNTCKDPFVLLRLALCYQHIQASTNAIGIYNYLLEVDSTNAYLYYQLANCYSQQEDYHTAARLITLAHLYNRNNMTYQEAMSVIFQKLNWKFRHLDFEPLYSIQKEADRVTIIASASPWIAYASCKAVWTYEPDYRQKMKTISSEDLRIIEEKECLLNALVTFESLDVVEKIEYAGLYTLSKALPDKRVNDFIMYEISLRQHPEISQQLSQDRINLLVDYVYTYRVKKVEVSQ
jgi:tetratricopeptide (TPR) repeat protein